MGLVSLPFFNRVGVFNYWSNVWDSMLNYRLFLFFEIYINIFFFRFFEDLTFNYLFNFFRIRNKKTKIGYFNFFKSNTFLDINIYLYIGRIWLFCYQGWYIIRISVIMPSKEIKKNVSKNINFIKLNSMFLKQTKFLNKYSYMNYKYRI